MHSTKQSSKSSGLRNLEDISKKDGANSSCYQTSSRWLLEKHTTRYQKYSTRGAPKNTFSVNPQNFSGWQLQKNASTLEFIFTKCESNPPLRLQWTPIFQCSLRNLLYFWQRIVEFFGFLIATTTGITAEDLKFCSK